MAEFLQSPRPIAGGPVTATYDNRIARLEVRLRQLKVRKHLADSRRRALDTKRSKREDARRKYLVGSAILARVAQGKFEEPIFRRWLDEHLSRDQDRQLFELPPRN